MIGGYISILIRIAVMLYIYSALLLVWNNSCDTFNEDFILSLNYEPASFRYQDTNFIFSPSIKHFNNKHESFVYDNNTK